MSSNFEKKDDSMKKLLMEAKDLYNSSIQMSEFNLEQIYNLDRTFLEESLLYPKSTLEAAEENVITAVYKKYFTGDADDFVIDPEEQRKVLLEAKDMANQVFETKEQFEDIQKTYAEAVDSEWVSKNSKEHRKHQMDVLQHLKEDSEKETDERRKKELLHKIEVMESVLSLDFILHRINTITESEMTSIIRQFFSEREGSYVIDRCNAKSKRFGYEIGWYKFFFNLEEKFLPEEYHVYNNLFLYAVMRFIGYADPYKKEDQAYVHAMVNSLTGVVYHKFTDNAVENMIIELIKTYDDHFSAYREKFEKDNTTHPTHPVRIEHSKKSEADRKNTLLDSLRKFQIPVPENIDDMSAKDLHNYFNDEMDKLIKRNKEDTKEVHGGAEVTDDGETVVVKPSFNKDKYANPVEIVDGKYYYHNDDNFTNFHHILKERGEANCRFMLELKNPDAPTEKLLNGDTLTDDELNIANKEASENFWYWVRFIVKIEEKQIKITMFNSLLWSTALLFQKPIVVNGARQTGKTVSILIFMKWLELYHKTRQSFDNIQILDKSKTAFSTAIMPVDVPAEMATDDSDNAAEKFVYYIGNVDKGANPDTTVQLIVAHATHRAFIELRYSKDFWEESVSNFIMNEHHAKVISAPEFDNIGSISETDDFIVVTYFYDDMVDQDKDYWSNIIKNVEEPAKSVLVSDVTGIPLEWIRNNGKEIVDAITSFQLENHE